MQRLARVVFADGRFGADGFRAVMIGATDKFVGERFGRVQFGGHPAEDLQYPFFFVQLVLLMKPRVCSTIFAIIDTALTQSPRRPTFNVSSA